MIKNLKLSEIVVHVSAWLLFLSLPVILFNRSQLEIGIHEVVFSPSYLLFTGLYTGIFYINAFVLIPYFYLKKNYWSYWLCVIILINGIYFLKPFDNLMHHHKKITITNDRAAFQAGKNRLSPPPNEYFRPDSNKPPGEGWAGRMPEPPPPMDGKDPFAKPKLDIGSLFLFAMVMALSAAYRLTKEWQLTEQRALKAEKEKSSAELSFLKAQINPHFLFNTLNNIYSLAVMEKGDEVADSIMKLSSIMRYMTDEAESTWVELNREISFISDYIDLQKLRTGTSTAISFEVKGKVKQQRIAPLVFISFIENAFKYGISKNQQSQIAISINVDDQQIRFICKNSLFLSHEDNRIGIGIKNTAKRLSYLYPEKHQLQISSQNGFFTIDLKINCV